MTFGIDFRWRCVVLMYVYALDKGTVSTVMGVSRSTLKTWRGQFEREGHVRPATRISRSSWPSGVKKAVLQFIKDNPCFLIEELKEFITENFPAITNKSDATICRVLRHDLQQSRKVLTKRAREAAPEATEHFIKKLERFYSSADQLVFVDETSKDARDAVRKYAWSRIGTPAVVNLTGGRGKRVSALCAMDVQGFFAWNLTEGTYDRQLFHKAMITEIIPRLNAYLFTITLV